MSEVVVKEAPLFELLPSASHCFGESTPICCSTSVKTSVEECSVEVRKVHASSHESSVD